MAMGGHWRADGDLVSNCVTEGVLTITEGEVSCLEVLSGFKPRAWCHAPLCGCIDEFGMNNAD